VDQKESSEAAPADSTPAPEPAPEAGKTEQQAEEYEEYELSLFEGASLTKEDLEEIAAEASRLNLEKKMLKSFLKLKTPHTRKQSRHKSNSLKRKLLRPEARSKTIQNSSARKKNKLSPQ